MRNTLKYFSGSEINRYFLPNLPHWINFSQTARCRRKISIRYLDIMKLRRNFSLNYNQALQFQYMFNKRVEQIKREQNIDFIPFEEEEKIFYDISNKIQSGIKIFNRPSFKRVHLVWVDSYFSNPQKLKKILDGSTMVKGHPVLVSLCKGSLEIEDFLTRNNLHNQNIRIMPAEMFSVFDLNGKMTTTVHLHLTSFFDKKQKVYLFLPRKDRPMELSGNIKLIYLKD
ncbi:MAG: hypothetical protein OXB84_04740 [Halobacteriovoraceae bacterium]|nr:hypothetical protein [Halobacteriovoraceae bacterium]